MKQISLIIPAFNAMNTIEGTLGSILCSTSEDIELVFIDDGSTDRTPDIFQSFKERTSFQCLYLHQSNQGAAAARNTAIHAATGRYLCFLDADDRMETGALDRLLALTHSNADIIGWDYRMDAGNKQREMRQADFDSPFQAIRNLMGGTMKWNLWLFAIKRELVEANHIRFLPGSDMGEDMGFILKSFSCAKQVIQVHEPLYCYNASNPSSISIQLNNRRRSEVSRNLDSAAVFLQNTSYAELCEQYLPHLKLFIKLPLLIGFSFKNYKLWYQWMPEANPYAMKNHALPFRVRLLQGIAARKFWLCVWLFNCCYRFLLRFK